MPKAENEEMGGEVRAEWIWAKKWAEQCHDQGGFWKLLSLRRQSGTVHERWQWKEVSFLADLLPEPRENAKEG